MSHKESSVVSLTILSKEYKIACDIDEQELLLESAKQLDEKMRKIRNAGKINGDDRIAVMVALNMAHELQLLQHENEKLNQNLNECLSNMRHKIENVLENE
ncbi:MAG: cell division protein ZapA [Methylococcales bacterium]|jgi:cell division protein ZapA|nr:cell division protein ZapA [Methylococcales bacterium]MCX7076611.1 cell division protein ZapA [Methylococcales bacterium]